MHARKFLGIIFNVLINEETRQIEDKCVYIFKV